MRHLFKKTAPFTAVLVLSGLLFFGYIQANKRLEGFLSRFSEENFNVGFSTGSVKLGLPLYLEVKDIKIEDSVIIPSLRIYLNLATLFLKQNIIVSTIKIADPVVKIEKGSEVEFLKPDFLTKKKYSRLPEKLLPIFYFSKIRIRNGTVIYDMGKGNTLKFTKIKGSIRRHSIYFKKDNSFSFRAAGFLKNKDSDFLSPLKVDGRIGPDGTTKARLWVNDVKPDMFGAILSRFIKEGRIDFRSEIEASGKKLLARCFFEAEGIVLKKGPGRRINTPLVSSFILLVNFKSNMVKIKHLKGNLLKFIF